MSASRACAGARSVTRSRAPPPASAAKSAASTMPTTASRMSAATTSAAPRSLVRIAMAASRDLHEDSGIPLRRREARRKSRGLRARTSLDLTPGLALDAHLVGALQARGLRLRLEDRRGFARADRDRRAVDPDRVPAIAAPHVAGDQWHAGACHVAHLGLAAAQAVEAMALLGRVEERAELGARDARGEEHERQREERAAMRGGCHVSPSA